MSENSQVSNMIQSFINGRTLLRAEESYVSDGTKEQSLNESHRQKKKASEGPSAPPLSRRDIARRIFYALQTDEFTSDHAETIDPQILWLPISGGLSCMHAAAKCWTRQQYKGSDNNLRFLPRSATAMLQSRLNTSSTTTTFTWEWIVQQATRTRPHRRNVAHQRDAGGDTLLDTMWNAWMEPSKQAAPYVSQFSAAVETVLENSDHLARVRRLVLERDECIKHGRIFSQMNDTTIPDAVYLVARFWFAYELVIDHAREDGHSRLSYLAATGSCPEALARLAVGIRSEEIQFINENQQTLLHIWAQSPKSVHRYRDGMVQPLLQAYPEAAKLRDTDGRLPIHVALHFGKPMRHIHVLWNQSPSSLHYPDPIKGLPMVALIVLAARKEKMHSLRELDQRNPSLSLNDWLDARRDTDQVRVKLNMRLVDSIYQVLLAHPQVIQNCEIECNPADAFQK